MTIPTTNTQRLRDLFAPLISNATATAIDSEVYDEESPPDKWFKSTTSTTYDSDNIAPAPADKLSKRARTYRKLLASGLFGKWGTICTLVKFIMYLGVLLLAVVQYILPSKHLQLYITSMCIYVIWQAATFVPSWIYGGFAGGLSKVSRMSLAWGGLYVNILFCLFQVATLVFLTTAFSGDKKYIQIGKGVRLGALLPLFMAVTLFVDRKLLMPSFRKLHLYYQGLISEAEEEADEKQHPTIAGINSITLQKVSRNACKAIGISDEATQTIDQLLDGQRIRHDREEALDDWTLTINKITKAVSFAPRSSCRSKSAITSKQCQDLICQMIIYLRQFLSTGRIEADEDSLMRTAPLSFAEALGMMFKICMQLPLAYFLCILPRSLYLASQSAVLPKLTGMFMNGVQTKDAAMALTGFIGLQVNTLALPFLLSLAAFAESKFTSMVIDDCRRKMRRTMLKGGTKFNEKHRPGSLNAAFTNHLK